MSQHDFEIANQGFPSFRSDLNSGLQALASNSAGATEPSTTFAYQFWYDETTDLLKLRNSDDDAWITLAAFDQTNDEWEIRSAVIQAVDSAGVVIKTDDGTTRITVADNGNVTIANDLTVSGGVKSNTYNNNSGNMNIVSTESVLIDIDSDNSQTNREFNVRKDGSTTLFTLDEAGSCKFNSGFGSVATAYGCRAWVNFSGNGTIRGSGNVSSVTDTGTGEYDVNFSTSMPDVNYAYSVMSEGGDTTSIVGGIDAAGGSTVNKIQVVTRRIDTNALLDVNFNSVAIFR